MLLLLLFLDELSYFYGLAPAELYGGVLAPHSTSAERLTVRLSSNILQIFLEFLGVMRVLILSLF